MMEVVHHFPDRCLPIPPVHIEYVDIGRTELSETRFDAEVQGFGAVTNVVYFLGDGVVAALEVSRVLPLMRASFVVASKRNILLWL